MLNSALFLETRTPQPSQFVQQRWLTLFVLRSMKTWASCVGLWLVMSCGRVLGADGFRFDEPACEAAECEESDAECSVHRDCNELGTPPSLCVRGACALLKNDAERIDHIPGECELVLGAESLRGPDPLFVFGALSNFRAGTEAAAATKSYALAVKDFASIGVTIAGVQHAPVAVVCDVGLVDDVSLDRTFDHLTQTLGLNVIVAPLPAARLRRSFERLQRNERGVLILSPLESSEAFSGIADDGLLWHMTPSGREIAAVYPPLLVRVEAHLRAQGITRPLKLALLASEDPADVEIADMVDAALALNGKTPAENYRAGNYRTYVIKGSFAYRSTMEALLESQPDIIVGITSPELLGWLQVLEQSWPASNGTRQLPFYVLSPKHAGADPIYTPFNSLRTVPAIHRRIVGVNFASDIELYDQYVRRLGAIYPEVPADELGAGGNFYDAAYFAIYAASASGELNPSGPSLAAGMQRLIGGGVEFPVGTAHIPRAMRVLAVSEGGISLRGTLGAPNFDVATGMRSGSGSVWCIEAKAPERFAYRYDVLRWNDAGDALVGDFPCFDF
jgi:hypothetical protein